MIKILANDGIDPVGKRMLEEAGFQVDTQTIPQNELAGRLLEYDAITVRSATKVRKELIDQVPNLKLIGRGGVGMDNIDVEYARSKNIAVINTPSASSISVAELVFAHFFGASRFLPESNRKMPVVGNTSFNELKKDFSKGTELRGKTLGVLGFGRIGKEVAKIGLGMGMKVLAYDLYAFDPEISLDFSGGNKVKLTVHTVSSEELFSQSDFITVHVPASETDKAVIGKEQFDLMKNGVILANCSRGGVIDEKELIHALDSGKVAFAGLDVFVNEPTPSNEILTHPKISLTPHIGASTSEAQERVGVELAQLIISHFSK